MTSQRGSHKALLGRKLGMTQVWDENGFFVPVTLVDVSTNVVTAVKSEETDGYKAIQIGYGQIDPHQGRPSRSLVTRQGRRDPASPPR